MKKGLVITLAVFAGLYWLLHLVLASSPVQSRVVEEIRKALSRFGFHLEIESIEFSAFTPKIYLNRVTLSATPKAEIPLPVPLTLDKLKLRFSPLALLSRRLVIEEATLFNPKIILPNADSLYRRIERMLKQRSRIEVDSGDFTVIVRRFGVVDAVVNVIAREPALAVRSRSVTAFLVNRTASHQNITVQSKDLEIERNKWPLQLTNVDVDADLTPESLRLNRAVVEGKDYSANIRGTTSLPFGKKGPDSMSVSYDVRLPLSMLSSVPDLSLPSLEGEAHSSGTVSLTRGSFAGEGKLRYTGVKVDGYAIGKGDCSFRLKDRQVMLHHALLGYGGGELVGKDIVFRLDDQIDLSGAFTLRNIRLERILDSVKEHDSPVRMGIHGTMQFHGTLAPAFRIDADTDVSLTSFEILDGDPKVPAGTTILGFPKGAMKGKLTFLPDRMDFQALLEALEGKAQTEGFVGFNNAAKVRVRTEGLSLTSLGRISSLRLGGKANLIADVDVTGSDARVSGSFEVADAEIADIVLGQVKGLAQFQNALLSFEDLAAATSLEPVRGNGFVDFRGRTHYRFNVEARRAEVDTLFGVFRKSPLTFEIPKGGEASLRLTIEGGHDESGIEIGASGTAKGVTWYGERWVSSNFSVRYRPSVIELPKVVLMKRSGALDVQGRFLDNTSTIELASQGLRLEDLDMVGTTPLSGEIVGNVRLDGKFPYPDGSGRVRVSKTRFRGEDLPDTELQVSSGQAGLEVMGSVFGERLRGRWSRNKQSKEEWELLLYFSEFDFGPALMILLGGDIPTLADVTASGDVYLSGRLANWSSLKGSGTIQTLNVGLRGTPMRNQQPLEVQIDAGTIRINRFNLLGRDSQVLVGLVYQPGKQIRASLDGKLDLQFLQPFIPGLEYGAGKVSMGVRVSGKPPAFDLLGNVILEDGVFRLKGLKDEFRSAQVQLSLSQDRINVDRFEALVSGGSLRVDGDVRINKFRDLIPHLKLTADRVGLKPYDSLTSRLTGEFTIRGAKPPYQLAGRCALQEVQLTSFAQQPSAPAEGKPLFTLDILCDTDGRVFVRTDTMNAEWKGSFHLLGDTDRVGLLGSAELVGGQVFFREKAFTLNTGTVRFESKETIAPRFNIAGQALVKEQKSQVPQEYQVNLQVIGTPKDYRILLNSSPALAESDIISLLVLGVTARSQEGNYVDLGTALVGQVPIQSKLESELGVQIKISPQTQTSQTTPVETGASSQTISGADVTVPMVEIRKEISKNTKLSYSNSLGSSTPVREVKVEHSLGKNITINGSVVDKPRGSSEAQTVQSYGLDFRYRFQFE